MLRLTNTTTGLFLLVLAVAVFAVAPNAVGWWIIWCGLAVFGAGFLLMGFAEAHEDDYDDQLRPRRD